MKLLCDALLLAATAAAMLALGCNKDVDPTFNVRLAYTDPTRPNTWLASGGAGGAGGASGAGGVGGASNTGPLLAYTPNGPFSVQVTVTPTSGNINAQAPGGARASVTIENAPAATTTSAFTATLVSQTTSDGRLSFVGSGALTWPPGGQIDLLLQTAGQLHRESVTMEVPQLEIAQGHRTAAGIPVCVRSTSHSGVVTLHVDNATVGGGTAADTMGNLEPGDCPVGWSSEPCADAAADAGTGGASGDDDASAGSPWHTHALVSVLPTSAASSDNLNAVTTLQNAPAFVTALRTLCLDPLRKPMSSRSPSIPNRKGPENSLQAKSSTSPSRPPLLRANQPKSRSPFK